MHRALAPAWKPAKGFEELYPWNHSLLDAPDGHRAFERLAADLFDIDVLRRPTAEQVAAAFVHATGTWRYVSLEGTDEILRLRGYSWLTRKAFAHAPVTLRLGSPVGLRVSMGIRIAGILDRTQSIEFGGRAVVQREPYGNAVTSRWTLSADGSHVGLHGWHTAGGINAEAERQPYDGIIVERVQWFGENRTGETLEYAMLPPAPGLRPAPRRGMHRFKRYD